MREGRGQSAGLGPGYSLASAVGLWSHTHGFRNQGDNLLTGLKHSGLCAATLGKPNTGSSKHEFKSSIGQMAEIRLKCCLNTQL